MLIGTLALMATGVLVALLVTLCAIGAIGPNPILGIRVPALLASVESWREGHRSAVLPTWLAALVACGLGALAVFTTPLNDWGLLLAGAPILAGLSWATARASASASVTLASRESSD